uniref:3CxxC-type domain-containing protein n=1 Tax=Pavo cristatus TaxID=9049 RepID=A0A8C9EVJ0_PAVCR
MPSLCTEYMKLMDPWTFQEDDSLQVHSLKPGWTEFLQNHVSGRFQCSQCLYKWSSAKVHILFHMCYGMVQMRIFRQACRQCHEPQLEEPIFTLENIERLLHNLVLKILEDFYNVPMQSADLLEVVVDGCHASGPHDRTRCEGCRLGVCSRPRAAMEHLVSSPAEPSRPYGFLWDMFCMRMAPSSSHKGWCVPAGIKQLFVLSPRCICAF